MTVKVTSKVLKGAEFEVWVDSCGKERVSVGNYNLDLEARDTLGLDYQTDGWAALSPDGIMEFETIR